MAEVSISSSVAVTSSTTSCLFNKRYRLYFSSYDSHPDPYAYPTIGDPLDHLIVMDNPGVSSNSIERDINPNPNQWWYGLHHELNNAHWQTGGFIVSLRNKNTSTDTTAKVRIVKFRNNEGTGVCDLIEATEYSATQYFTSGQNIWVVPCKDWTASESTDMFCVEWYLTAPGTGYVFSSYNADQHSYVEYGIEDTWKHISSNVSATSSASGDVHGLTTYLSSSVAAVSSITIQPPTGLELDETLIKMYQCSTWVSTNHGGTINLSEEINNDELNNIFSDVTDYNRRTGLTTYRKIFIRNENVMDYPNPHIWISTNTVATADTISICFGTASDTIADVSGYTFVTPTSKEDANVLVASTLSEDESFSLWIKRVVTANGSGYENNYAILTMEDEPW